MFTYGDCLLWIVAQCVNAYKSEFNNSEPLKNWYRLLFEMWGINLFPNEIQWVLWIRRFPHIFRYTEHMVSLKWRWIWTVRRKRIKFMWIWNIFVFRKGIEIIQNKRIRFKYHVFVISPWIWLVDVQRPKQMLSTHESNGPATNSSHLSL